MFNPELSLTAGPQEYGGTFTEVAARHTNSQDQSDKTNRSRQRLLSHLDDAWEQQITACPNSVTICYKKNKFGSPF